MHRLTNGDLHLPTEAQRIALITAQTVHTHCYINGKLSRLMSNVSWYRQPQIPALPHDNQAIRPTWGRNVALKFPVCVFSQHLLDLLSHLHDLSASTSSLLRLPHITDGLPNYINLCTRSLTLPSRWFVSMAPRKSRKTKTPANNEQSETAPSVDARELVPNMIYTYAVTRDQELSSMGHWLQRIWAAFTTKSTSISHPARCATALHYSKLAVASTPRLQTSLSRTLSS